MENIYAVLLLHKLGKEVSEGSLKDIIAAAGGEAEEVKIKSLVASLKGVDIAKELESASLAVSPTAGIAPAEAKKEEAKPKEEKKEAAAEGLSALFG